MRNRDMHPVIRVLPAETSYSGGRQPTHWLSQLVGDNLDIVEAHRRSDSAAESFHNRLLGGESAAGVFQRPPRRQLSPNLPFRRRQHPIDKPRPASSRENFRHPLRLDDIQPDSDDHPARSDSRNRQTLMLRALITLLEILSCLRSDFLAFEIGAVILVSNAQLFFIGLPRP